MLSNGYQNYYNSFINNNIQIQNQNNYNLQLQNNISDSNFYNKEKSSTYINNNLSFNIFETNINGNNMNQINNNAMMYENNNQQILENQNQYNPNYQFNNEQQLNIKLISVILEVFHLEIWAKNLLGIL